MSNPKRIASKHRYRNARRRRARREFKTSHGEVVAEITRLRDIDGDYTQIRAYAAMLGVSEVTVIHGCDLVGDEVAFLERMETIR
jgi:hypothetical protein